MKIVILLTSVVHATIEKINDNASWNFFDAEWVESKIKVSSYKTHEILRVYDGKFGLQSVKTAVGGFIVNIPSVRTFSRGLNLPGTGCDSFTAYKLLGWRAKSKRKRVKRRKWIGIMKRGECSFTQKIRLATKLGASAVIIIDNIDTLLPVSMNTLGTSIPSSIINKADGEELISLIAASNSPLILHKQVGRVKVSPVEKQSNSVTNHVRSELRPKSKNELDLLFRSLSCSLVNSVSVILILSILL